MGLEEAYRDANFRSRDKMGVDRSEAAPGRFKSAAPNLQRSELLDIFAKVTRLDGKGGGRCNDEMSIANIRSGPLNLSYSVMRT